MASLGVQSAERKELRSVLIQHADAAVSLATIRRVQAGAASASLVSLARMDELLEAHLEALRRAPTEAFAALDEEVASGWSGAVFVDAVVSLALGAGERLARLEEMVFAGQVSPDIIEAVLVWDAGEGRFENQRRLQRWSAVNGTPELPEAREFPGWASRLLSHCPTPENRVAWAHVLTGARGAQLEVLVEALRQSVETSPDVASVALRAMALDGARGELERLAAARTDLRRLVRRVGIVGDPFYCGWLLKQMSNPKLARVAGESFSLITGVDLALRDLDCRPPDDFASGPNDDPNDPNVDMDADDGLPWPDPEKVAAWWKENERGFAAGTRYFMGQPPSPAHCLRVLRTGYQRQRFAAAIWRCILQPGTPLFPTDSPAWRQKRWLAALGE